MLTYVQRDLEKKARSRERRAFLVRMPHLVPQSLRRQAVVLYVQITHCTVLQRGREPKASLQFIGAVGCMDTYSLRIIYVQRFGAASWLRALGIVTSSSSGQAGGAFHGFTIPQLRRRLLPCRSHSIAGAGTGPVDSGMGSKSAGGRFKRLHPRCSTLTLDT